MTPFEQAVSPRLDSVVFRTHSIYTAVSRLDKVVKIIESAVGTGAHSLPVLIALRQSLNALVAQRQALDLAVDNLRLAVSHAAPGS